MMTESELQIEAEKLTNSLTDELSTIDSLILEIEQKFEVEDEIKI